MSIGETGRNLIVLVSQPRAGSTLLQRMLGAHPDVHTVSEPWIALQPCFGLREEGLSSDYDHSLARTAALEFLRLLPEGEEAYVEGVRRMLSHLYDRALQQAGKRVFLDKTPRYYFILPELRRLFPDARFVFLLRNPLAVLASILETWVKTPDARDLVGHWHDLVTAPAEIVRAIRASEKGSVVVRYEDLVDRPTPTMVRVSAELGLEFRAETLTLGAPNRNASPFLFGDRGLAFQEDRPISARRDRWREVLTRYPVWHALAREYVDRLGPAVVSAFGERDTDLHEELAKIDDPADARRAAATLLSGPPSRDVAARAAEVARARADELEKAAAERLAVIEEQTNAIAVFRGAVNGRDTRLAALEQELAALNERLTSLGVEKAALEARVQRFEQETLVSHLARSLTGNRVS